MMDRQPNDRFDLNELFDTHRELLEKSSNPKVDVSKITTSPLLDTQEPRCNERIVRAPDQFIFLGVAMFYEYDLDPNSYNEAIFDKDLRNWQSTMKIETESMNSNHV